jgi:hypothetical protein
MRNHTLSGNPGTLIQVALWSCLILVLNQVAELKDREVYRLFYESAGSCEGLECVLISAEVRSPIFLSLLLAGQRLGVDFDLLFTLISLFSLWLAAWAMMRTAGDDLADARFTLMSLTFGTWLYLIQVKLFLGIALYLLARQRQKTWQRVALVIAAVVTHETILLVVLLDYLWRPMTVRSAARVGFAFTVLAVMLFAFLGEATNVVATAVERIDHYNQLVAEGGVSSIPRLSILSALLFLFGLSGLLPLRRAFTGAVDKVQLKSAVWMFLPWFIFLALAGSEIFAIRLSELALLHAFWVVKLAPDYTYPSRLAALAVAVGFGAFTFVRDVGMV